MDHARSLGREALVPAGDERFSIDLHVVTVEQYKLCVRWSCPVPVASVQSPYALNRRSPDEPVLYVSHEAAHKYCTWIGRRLPSAREFDLASTFTYRAGGLDIPKFSEVRRPDPLGDRGMPQELLDGLSEWTASGEIYGTPPTAAPVIAHQNRDGTITGRQEHPSGNGDQYIGFRCVS